MDATCFETQTGRIIPSVKVKVDIPVSVIALRITYRDTYSFVSQPIQQQQLMNLTVRIMLFACEYVLLHSQLLKVNLKEWKNNCNFESVFLLLFDVAPQIRDPPPPFFCLFSPVFRVQEGMICPLHQVSWTCCILQFAVSIHHDLLLTYPGMLSCYGNNILQRSQRKHGYMSL